MLLALDTAFSACSVALATTEGEVVSARHLLQNRGQAETLVPMVDEVMKEAGVKPNDITRIIVTRGPGTFAGVRVGIAFARTMALATGAKVLGLTSFEALAGALSLNGTWDKPLPLVVAIPAGREGFSVEMFAAASKSSVLPKSTKGPEGIALKDMSAWVGAEKGIIAGPKLDTFPDIKGFEKTEYWPTAEDLIRVSINYPEGADQETAAPLYMRPPDAAPQKPSPFTAGS